jgi:uncharacterized protein YktA (UPF0223 family)
MSFFKPYELFYYEEDNKQTTRCVENFASIKELLERKAEIKRISNAENMKMGFSHLPVPEEKEGSAT